MADKIDVNSLKGPFTFYMEGIQTQYSQIIISGEEGGYTHMSVDLPLSPDRKKIKAIRPKTIGQAFFGNDQFLIMDGELSRKRYWKQVTEDQTVLGAAFNFGGPMGNLAMMKYALQNNATPGQGIASQSAGWANQSSLYLLNGYSSGVSVTTGAQVNPNQTGVASQASSINRKLIGQRFLAGLKKLDSSGGFDMAEAFREMMRAFVYGTAKPENGKEDPNGISVRGTMAASYLGIIDHRFRLIDSLVGVTAQDLVQLFYAAAQSATSKEINVFMDAILMESVVGEASLLEVLRLLAYRSFHSITEAVCPPLLVSSGTATIPAGDAVIGRMMLTPRLFSADPPVCNVFFPHMVSSITDMDVLAMKTTRLITTQSLPTQVNQPVVFASVSPLSLERELIHPDGAHKDPLRFDFRNQITTEEAEVGVLATTQQNMYGASTMFDEKTIGPWFDKTNPLRFYVSRTEGQSVSISMEFNPFVAIGYPGLFIDDDLGIGRGTVGKAVHVITPSGARTVVTLTHCIFEDACEFPQPDANLDTGFDRGSGPEIGTFQKGGADEAYMKSLGCHSLWIAGVAAGFDYKLSPSEMASKFLQSFSMAQSPAIEKDAVYAFIARGLVSRTDLETIYAANAVGPTLPAPSSETTELPPVKLDLPRLYADGSKNLNVIVTSDDGSKKSVKYIAAAGVTPEKFQVRDRVGPVLAYVEDVGD